MDKFVFDTQSVCEFFGISRKTLASWEKKGAPKVERGKWDLKQLVEWKHGHNEDLNPEVKKMMADIRYREAKADMAEIEKLEMTGQYVAVEDIEKSLSETFTRIKQGLIYMGHRIATEFSAQFPELALDAKRLVDEEVAKALGQLAETGCYKAKRKADSK